MLLAELTLEFDGLLVQLLTSLQALLLQLLPALAELLLQLGQARLVLLFGLGDLLAGLGNHLLALLAGLFPQFSDLPFRLTADGLAIDQLIALLLGLSNDVVSLLTGLGDELVLLRHELVGLHQLSREGIPNGIHQFDGVLFVHETSTAEGDAGAVQDDFLQLIQLVEHGGQLRLGHQRGAWRDY